MTMAQPDATGRATTIQYFFHISRENLALEARLQLGGLVAAVSGADPTTEYRVTGIQGRLCRAGDSASCGPDGIQVRLWPADREIEIALNKSAFLDKSTADRQTAAWGSGAILTAGDELTEISVESRTPVPYPAAVQQYAETRITDRLPDTGKAPPLRIRYGSANEVVGLRIGDGSGVVNVSPGRAWPVPIVATNSADSSVQLDMAYEFWGPDGAVEMFSAQGPARVLLPAKETLTYHAFVVGPHEAFDFAGVTLAVTAAGDARTHALAYSESRLVPGAFLAEAHNHLSVAGRRTPVISNAGGLPADADCEVPFFPNCAAAYLTTNRDPSAADWWGEIKPDGGTTCDMPAVCLAWTMRTEGPIMGTFRIRDDAEATVGLTFAAPAATPTTIVNVTLSATSPDFGQTRVLELSRTVDLATPATEVLLSGTPHSMSFSRPLSTVEFQLNINISSAAPMAGGWHASPPRIVAERSQIQLPLADAPVLLAQATPGFPFQVAVTEAVHVSAAPGTLVRFPFSILSQAAHDIRIKATVEREGGSWPVRVVPSDVIVVEPGGSWTGNLEVRVPVAAPLGERLTAWLVLAPEELDPIRLHFEVTATPGGTAGETLDDGPAQPTRASIPATSMLASAAAIGALGGVLWRRRGNA